MNTDSGQWLFVTPIAGYAALSEISIYFEQDVAETLQSTIRMDETIVWGCNCANLSATPPFIFGYLIITSRQLVCVQFSSDLQTDTASFVIQLLQNPLKLLVKGLFGAYESSSHPWAAMGLRNVPYPSQPLTPAEKNSRRVTAKNLSDLDAIRLVRGSIDELIVGFRRKDELVVAFYSPHQAEKTYQALRQCFAPLKTLRSVGESLGCG